VMLYKRRSCHGAVLIAGALQSVQLVAVLCGVQGLV
jgi:hypothetical protein